MNYRSIVVIAVAGAGILGLMAAGCESGNGVAGGGDRTADFYVAYDAFRMKLEACAPGAQLFRWSEPGNTLPMLDGLEAEMAVELSEMIGYANQAYTCDEFFAALNGDKIPATCDTPGRTCRKSVIESCLQTPDGNVLIELDCADMGLSCLNGECNLGVCSTDQCDGDTVVECDDDGIRHEFRCGPLGLACGHGADAFQCVGTGEQCSTNAMSPKRTGNLLSRCLGGKVATLDCASITDSRRECSQSWLDANSSVTSTEIVTTWLHKVCSPRYSECADGVSMCAEGSTVFCRDGLFEEVYCPDFGFEDCVGAGSGVDFAMCTGFPAESLQP